MLPLPVLQRAAAEMTDYENSGMSVMEMSHRSKIYESIIEGAESSLRKVMGIPDNYHVLFLQGGATQQFAAIPMNFLKTKASYAVTGNFSKNAIKEAKKYGEILTAADMADCDYTRIPTQDELKIDPAADYFYTCMNNTVYGSKWGYIPETGDVPIFSDISSCILSEPLDVSKFGLLYAGAQKNMAPAGLTVVIIRKDLISEPMPATPTMLNYGIMAEKQSMYNTPPTYQIYILKLVLDWLESLGGVEGMAAINRKKAGLLYDYLDHSKFYISNVAPDSRSMMNVTYHLPTTELDAKFVKESIALGFQNLKGYRSVGGIRASIYNAMPVEGVEALVEFMAKFEKENA
jgi:phosphoserine aminotransferase